MGILGTFCITISFILSIYSILGFLISMNFKTEELKISARWSSYLTLPIISIAFSILVYSFVTHDFSIKYVFNHSNLAMEPIYTWVAIYAGNEGSLLYISAVISIGSFLTIKSLQKRIPESVPHITMIMMGILSFFLGVMLFLADPFTLLEFQAEDGRGINPLLKHPGMFTHPPLLMAGLATISIPFAITTGMLISGNYSDKGTEFVRISTLIIWLMLGIGLLLGSWWAYTILGWGGYWAWDPIENVGLMPWLVLTALIHSLIVQRRRGMFRLWNLVLINIAFVLSQFGMFINRGGPVVSVHSFAASTLGYIFLSFMILSIIFPSIIFLWKYKELINSRKIDSFLSKESSFLINNFLLLAITFVTLWGLVFPLFSELFGKEPVTVGTPYYNSVNGPLLLILILLMSIGPILPWKEGTIKSFFKNIRFPLMIFVLCIIICLIFFSSNFLAILAFSSLSLVLATILQEWIIGTKNRIKRFQENIFIAFIKLINGNRTKHGGYIVHLSILMLAMGIIGTNFYQEKADYVISKDKLLDFHSYQIELSETETKNFQDRIERKAKFNIYQKQNNSEKDLKKITELEGSNAIYPSFNMASVRAAIHSTILGDLYIVPSEFISEDELLIRISINPFISWLWFAGPIFFIGAIFTLWPRTEKNTKL